MNAYISRALAVMIAAGSVSIVSAQNSTFAPGPVASAATTASGDQALVDSIVGALNADPSLKDSKVTVGDDDGHILLTGATQTREQRQKISEIAAAQAGDVMIVNTVLDSAS